MEGMSAGAVGQARHSVTAWQSQIPPCILGFLQILADLRILRY